jgi:GNAT superfamily N-acetyltransferase
MDYTLRPLKAEDSGEIERLYAQSAAHLRAVGDESDFRFGAGACLRDGFGEDPAFAGIVVEQGQGLIGYLLYTWGYDTDRAMRHLFVIDLLVDERVRGLGVGRALMARAAAVCRARGGGELFWAVYEKNESAMAFYRRLGAVDLAHLRFMTMPV